MPDFMTTISQSPPPGRLVSLDAYRGFVMLFMASSFGSAAKTLGAGSMEVTVWDQIHEAMDHVAWVGCSPWDLIQAAFLFIVGAAMPYAYANRRAKGESWWHQFRHAAWRSAILVVLGIFLASNGSPRTNFVFTNVLSQIGLGYIFVFLLLGRRMRWQMLAIVLILVADWAVFALYPVAFPKDLIVSNAFPIDWRYQSGFFEHWEKHANVAADFDQWFLNFFPREQTFVRNDGGYTTLNFIPSIATMLIGVVAAEWLRTERPARRKIVVLFLAGSFCLIAGHSLGMTICPVVKRLWTPSWVLYSGSWTLWLLAFFYGVIDVAGWKRWAFPLVVVGMNSLAMYMMAQLTRDWTRATLATHLSTVAEWSHYWLSPNVPSDPFGGFLGPIVSSAAVLGAWWLVCYWLYRRRIFVRI
jgi:predicted acyltransferase